MQVTLGFMLMKISHKVVLFYKSFIVALLKDREQKQSRKKKK